MSAANPRTPEPLGSHHPVARAGRRPRGHAFEWDLFLLAGHGRAAATAPPSPTRTRFGSPDGIWSDPDGRVWIQTDGTQPLGANDQMLAANPYASDADGTPELRRFLTGVARLRGHRRGHHPRPAHDVRQPPAPRRRQPSQWPHLDGITTPRSATVVVTKDDGGVIGT